MAFMTTKVSIDDGYILYTNPLNVPAPAPTLSDAGAAAKKVVKLVTSVGVNDGKIVYSEPLNVTKVEPVQSTGPVQIDVDKVEQIKEALKGNGFNEIAIVAGITLLAALIITKK